MVRALVFERADEWTKATGAADLLAKAGGLPALAEIRSLLEREWYAERRKEANEHFYQTLRARYDVEIRLPADSTGKTLAVR